MKMKAASLIDSGHADRRTIQRYADAQDWQGLKHYLTYAEARRNAELSRQMAEVDARFERMMTRSTRLRGLYEKAKANVASHPEWTASEIEALKRIL